jgi:MFS family permease
MRALRTTIEFIKNKKLRSISCFALEFIRMIFLIIILTSILPKITENVSAFNALLDSAPSDKEASLDYLTQHIGEIEEQERESRQYITNMSWWIILVNSIFYILFFALLFNKISIKFILKYLIASAAMFMIIFGIIGTYFGRVVKYSTESLVVPEKSLLMYLIPLTAILVTYIIFTAIFVAIKENSIKSIIYSLVQIAKRKMLGLIGRYLLAGAVIMCILIFTFLLTVLSNGFFSFLISILLAIFLVIPLMTIMKIYLSNYLLDNSKIEDKK